MSSTERLAITVEDSGKWLKKEIHIWRIATFAFALLAVALLVALIVVNKQKEEIAAAETGNLKVRRGSGECKPLCGSSNPNGNVIDLREPNKPGPFHDLTVDEISKLQRDALDDALDELLAVLLRETEYIWGNPRLKKAGDIPRESPDHPRSQDHASLMSSYIFQIDLFLLPKADVLSYLDSSGPQPARRARVIMMRGDLDPPRVEEYTCGPLPNVVSCDLLNSTSRRNPIEFSVRPLTDLDVINFNRKILPEVDRQIGYILNESYGVTWTQCTNCRDCLGFGIVPLGTGIIKDINQRKIWLIGTYSVPLPSVHRVDHALFVNMNGSDVSNWAVEKIWYAGQQYCGFQELIEGYNSSSIPKSRMEKPVYSENLYSTLHRRGDPLPPKPQRPPMQVEPDGKRYSLKNRKVEYMGWTFNFCLSALSGPAVFDVRFKGERIAYEISMAEIAVYYSGDTPFSTFFDDSKRGPIVYTASQCLFEQNNGYPLRRHLSYLKSEDQFYGGMSDSVLTLRSVMTISNYDYVTDFIFHQNGVFESRFISKGYIISYRYTETGRPYGFRIEDTVLGNLHQHFVHFKADLDIAGTSNRYQTVDIVPEEGPLLIDPRLTFHQTHIVSTVKRTEQETLFNFNFSKPKYHLVYNNASKTSYGEFRSYRIQMNGMSKFLFPEGEDNEPTLSWARNQLVVTKHKDDEFLSSSNYGMLDSADPVVKFSSFYEDDDNIEDQDLVFWISSGLHHIAHTEDLPVTPAVGNHLSFFLLPYNYFPECPSMGSREAIYIEHLDQSDLAKGVKVVTYGNSRDQCVIPRATLEDDVLKNPDQVLETRV